MCLIFCLPHAGGGAHHYFGWTAHLAPEIEWEPLDYAGHFPRMDEPAYTTFEQAVQDLTEGMMARADGRLFALFGHSMGGALAYEIAQYMAQRQLSEDLLFIAVSSALPPHRRDPNMPRYYEMPDRDFVQHLIDTGGMTAQSAAQAELMASYLPLIRQDYRLYHQYQSLSCAPLSTPLYALWGDREEECNDNMPAWADYSHAFNGSKAYPGDHFYWRDCLDAVTADISAIVGQISRR
ncbi:thioesterase II family protein [Serratia fonticola]|uniref:thioesterase II family protein n=1 Tax=Serratia fonticola TaxID=47917 RepID=UPI003BB65F81